MSKKPLRKKLFEKDFFAFCEYYFRDNFLIEYAKYHKEYAKCLGNGNNVIFLGHRESNKTGFARRYIIYKICMGDSPFIIWCSYNVEDARLNLFALVQELQLNKKIIQDYGHLFFDDGKTIKKAKGSQKKTVGEFITNNGILVKSLSLGKSIRGALHRDKKGVNRRPTLIVFDDIDTDDSVSNPKIIEKNYRKLKGQTMGALDTSCQKIVLGNVINEDGLMPRLEDDYKKIWAYFRLPLRNYEIGDTFINSVLQENIGAFNRNRYVLTKAEAEHLNLIYQKKTGDSRKPYVSEEYLLKELGEIAFGQNHRLKPYLDGSVIFKKSWISYDMVHNERDYRNKIIIAIDPAQSEKTHSDPLAITVIKHVIKDDGVHKYVLDAIELKDQEKGLDNVEKVGQALVDKYGCDLMRIEGNNGGVEIAKRFSKRGIRVDIINPTKDKVTRAIEVQGMFSNGLIHIAPYIDESYVKQLTSFPNVQHDDLTDATVYGIMEFSGQVIQQDMKTQELLDKYLGNTIENH